MTELISIGLICDPVVDTNTLYSFFTSQLSEQICVELLSTSEKTQLKQLDFEVPAFCKAWLYVDEAVGVQRRWGGPGALNDLSTMGAALASEQIRGVGVTQQYAYS